MKKYLSLIALLSISSLSYGNNKKLVSQLLKAKKKHAQLGISNYRLSDIEKEQIQQQIQQLKTEKRSLAEAAATGGIMGFGATGVFVLMFPTMGFLVRLGGMSAAEYFEICANLWPEVIRGIPTGQSLPIFSLCSLIGAGVGYIEAKSCNEDTSNKIKNLMKKLKSETEHGSDS